MSVFENKMVDNIWTEKETKACNHCELEIVIYKERLKTDETCPIYYDLTTYTIKSNDETVYEITYMTNEEQKHNYVYEITNGSPLGGGNYQATCTRCEESISGWISSNVPVVKNYVDLESYGIYGIEITIGHNLVDETGKIYIISTDIKGQSYNVSSNTSEIEDGSIIEENIFEFNDVDLKIYLTSSYDTYRNPISANCTIKYNEEVIFEK